MADGSQAGAKCPMRRRVGSSDPDPRSASAYDLKVYMYSRYYYPAGRHTPRRDEDAGTAETPCATPPPLASGRAPHPGYQQQRRGGGGSPSCCYRAAGLQVRWLECGRPRAGRAGAGAAARGRGVAEVSQTAAPPQLTRTPRLAGNHAPLRPMWAGTWWSRRPVSARRTTPRSPTCCTTRTSWPSPEAAQPTHASSMR
jgi:hypothetical protein